MHQRCSLSPWVRQIPLVPTPVFLPGESHGQRSLAGNAPYGCKESAMPEAIEYSSIEVKCLLFGLYFPVDFISFTFMSD